MSDGMAATLPGPIRIRPGEDGKLIVILPYSPQRVEKIKSISGRRWHPQERYWTVPGTEGILERLRALFAGEVVEAETPAAPLLEHANDPLLAKVREAVRARHFSPSTEKSYVAWAARFLRRQGAARPETLGETEVGRFLSSLASDSHVSASTQNQALNALLFLYQQVLGKKIGFIEGVVRAKRPRRLPVVLSRQEVRAVLGLMSGTPRLMATLLYGAGLRLLECCRLRVKDVDFAQNQIVVRAGKGDKDRYTMFPSSAQEALRGHLDAVQRQHQEDLRSGLGSVALPDALVRKYPGASQEWGWQWVFPAISHYADNETGQRRRHHLHESVLQKAFKAARARAGIAKPASCHSLRHYSACRIIPRSPSVLTAIRRDPRRHLLVEAA